MSEQPLKGGCSLDMNKVGNCKEKTAARWLVYLSLYWWGLLPNAAIGTGQQMACNTDRDLKGYETIKYQYKSSQKDERRQVDSKMREFLWGHWHDRRLAVMSFKSYSTEGDSKITTFFVEPDNQGTWQICVDEQEEITDSSNKHGVNKRNFIVSNLERVAVQNGHSRQLDEGITASGDNYILIFKDERGDVIGKW